MRKLAVVLILCGVGLFGYGLWKFLAYRYWTGPRVEADIGALGPRVEATIGAVLLTAGCLLWRKN
jgi:hypothetical protein